MEHLLAKALKLVWHAGSECELDVLCKSLADLELSLDVVGDVSASERDRGIVSHDIAMVDGD